MNISINTEVITLDQFLKFSGACATGGAAKIAIKDGEVKVNGEVCTQRGKKLSDGDKVEYNGNVLLVSRK
ncbi:RNA-binding protein [Clostridia bacterium]|nr:RNA-binding protein [Clostridia bacterium]